MASLGRQGRRTKKASRKRRVQRTVEEYYVHHTDNDMLLLLPSDLKETVTVVKRVRRAEDAGAAISTDSGWGSVMPCEIVHRIFRLVVESEGAVPALCRLASVCRLWRQVASTPDLWRRVSVSRCWIVPNKRGAPKVKDKIRRTIHSFIENRLSQVSDFSVHHWQDYIPLILQCLSSCCPLLTSLTLSHCSRVPADALVSVGQCCPLLATLNLQDSQVQGNAVPRFLKECGSGLRYLYLSYSDQTSGIVNLLARGCCPDLRLLEVNRSIMENMVVMCLSIEGLQASCPKLEVLRLLNINFSVKSKHAASPEGPGFPRLQELCLATSSSSFTDDSVCRRLLKDSSQLRVLDLRGCYMVTPEGISQLPCPDVERLYLGMYCTKITRSMPYEGCCLLTRRWRHSLQELDLTSQHFNEDDLSQALAILSGGGANDTLQSLSLMGTKVMGADVRNVLSGCPALIHLDLTSCRHIPRGLKCVHRGLENIHQCLKTLSAKLLEQSGD